MEWFAAISLFFLFEYLYRRYGLSNQYVYLRVLCVLGITVGISVVSSLSTFEKLNSLILLIGLLFIAWVDGLLHKIPNIMLMALVLLRIMILFFQVEQWLVSLVALIVWCGGLALFHFLAKQGIGAGDVKLMGVLGFYTGLWHSSVAFLIASAMICILGIGLWVIKREKFNRSLPLAPFLFIGVLSVIVHSVLMLGGFTL